MKNSLMLLSISILYALSITSCSNSSSNAVDQDLLATNQAQSIQLTIQAGIIQTQTFLNNQPQTQENELIQPTTSPLQTQTPVITPSPIPTKIPLVIVPTLLSSGNGNGSFYLEKYAYAINILALGKNCSISVRETGTARSTIDTGGWFIDYQLPKGNYAVSSDCYWEVWSVGTAPIAISGNHGVYYTFDGVSYMTYAFQILEPATYHLDFNLKSSKLQYVSIDCNTDPGQFHAGTVKFVFVMKDVKDSFSADIDLVPGYCQLHANIPDDSTEPDWELLLIQK